tara:strand:- start:638 stop:994 length:357 start_codon:yes stop_codon:yes gene_type:complete
MPRFTGQNKKRINPRYFLNETVEGMVDEQEAPTSFDFDQEEKRELVVKQYLEALMPHANGIILRLANVGGNSGIADAEDFAAELAEAAEGNNAIDILEFLLASVGENPEDIIDTDRFN